MGYIPSLPPKVKKSQREERQENLMLFFGSLIPFLIVIIGGIYMLIFSLK
jgi:hypothetical protein